jgi:hypothetical protein
VKPPLQIVSTRSDTGEEETVNPTYADARNFFKVERWDRDNLRVADLLYAGNRLEKARAIFNEVVRRRPRGRYMIRQGIRVLQRWPLE